MHPIKPPIAKKIPYSSIHHHDQLTDPYHWLRDKNWPEVNDADVLAYLNAENEYYHSIMGPYAEHEEAIYQELIRKIKLKDESVPVKKGDYYYYTRTQQDSNYPIYCRKKDLLTAKEEVILDENALASNSIFFSLDAISVSQNHQLLAYSTDTTGDEHYRIYIKNLTTHELLEDQIDDVIGNIVWHENNTGFFYCKLNQNWRPDRVYFHKLNTSTDADVLIYFEHDPKNRIHIYKTTGKRFLIINSQAKENTECHFIDLSTQHLSTQLIQKRSEKHLYSVNQIGSSFYILTNDTGRNFRLVKTSIDQPNQSAWEEMIAHSNQVYLQNIALYDSYFALESRVNGLEKISIYDYNMAHVDDIPFKDPTYSAHIVSTTHDAQGVRISYSSLNLPETTLEYHFKSRKMFTLKTKEILDGYDPNLYQSERIFAISNDGTHIPISLVYKKSLLKKDGSNPLYLYGYGSYGYGMPASFRTHIIPLLDRGFVYAIAHIRGGDEMGYEWYEDAKFLTKKKTFDDFIASADYLISEKYTQKNNIVISGGSAGGLLIGVCINERPDLYKAAIAHVPFVDVLNTMLDDSLPLTPTEFKEWGNPAQKEYYDYIKSYSPYDNIKPQAYPPLYVTAGISDPRVTYWEPAKWVAKLRNVKTNDAILLLETNMNAGHAGASGRFGFLREIAKEYNFILMIFQMNG